MDAAEKVIQQMREYRQAVERYTVYGEHGDVRNAQIWRERAAVLESSISTVLLRHELAHAN
jgi:hypothetical protein